MKKRKEIIVDLGNKTLTAKERREFSKNNPGMRLSFMLRFPNFPLIISLISLLIVLIKPILVEMILLMLSKK